MSREARQHALLCSARCGNWLVNLNAEKGIKCLGLTLNLSLQLLPSCGLLVLKGHLLLALPTCLSKWQVHHVCCAEFASKSAIAE